MTRLPLTLTAKVEAMEANALCPKCFKPFNGNVEYDHDPPLGAGGKDHDEKPMTPLHSGCHTLKTKNDKKVIAKTNRMGGGRGSQIARRKAGKTKPIPSPTKSMRQEQYKRKKEWARVMRKRNEQI